jgi:undecaprenyl-diphosphatase
VLRAAAVRQESKLNTTQAIILGVIEGITEFLPVSSTGHMIVASSFMQIQEDDFVKGFQVIIQFAAILSVLVLYWNRFLPNWNFYKKLLIAFLPTAILGFLFKDVIDKFLESALLVAWSLLVGGFILIWSDYIFQRLQNTGRKISSLTVSDSIKLGLYQSIAMIPGVSRSGATIMGGLMLGMNKKEATEFSFFLAVPTMAAATVYKMFKIYKHLNWEHIQVLSIGFVVSFVVSIIAIKFFIGIVARYGFKGFGYYRVLVGITLLILIYTGRL